MKTSDILPFQASQTPRPHHLRHRRYRRQAAVHHQGVRYPERTYLPLARCQLCQGENKALFGACFRFLTHLKGINRVTGGRGVDCVLNSLSGELLRASWGCLETFGSFIEIGLRDITNNMRLDMRPFRKSTSFTFINNHTLFKEDPDTFYDVFHKTFDLIDKGILRAPSSVVVYPVGKVSDAFRVM